MKKLIYLLSMSLSILSCSGQYNNYKNKCEQTGTINCPVMYFNGFFYSEIQRIFVKDINNDIVVDTFSMELPKFEYDSINLSDWGAFSKDLNTKDTYKLYISGYQPFVLSNIKTYMQVNYDNFANPVYICKISSYDLNGVTYHDHNPTFIKDSARVDTH